jgi:hypothetical protein
MNSHPYTVAQQTHAQYYPPIWRELTINRNAQDQDEAFAIGPDGYVWRYLTDTSSGAPGRLVSTGLAAAHFALIAAPGSPRVLIAAERNRLCLMRESADATSSWHDPQTINFMGLQDALEIIELHCISYKEHVLIGVLAVHGKAGVAQARHFWVAKWLNQSLQFRSSPVLLDGSDPLGNQFILHNQSSEQTLQ